MILSREKHPLRDDQQQNRVPLVVAVIRTIIPSCISRIIPHEEGERHTLWHIEDRHTCGHILTFGVQGQ